MIRTTLLPFYYYSRQSQIKMVQWAVIPYAKMPPDCVEYQGGETGGNRMERMEAPQLGQPGPHGPPTQPEPTPSPPPPLPPSTPLTIAPPTLMDFIIQDIRDGEIGRGRGVFKGIQLNIQSAYDLTDALASQTCRLLYVDLSFSIQAKHVLDGFMKSAVTLPPILDLSGCSVIGDAVIPELCLMIRRCGVKSLILRGCKNLTRIGVQLLLSSHCGLSMLDVSGCKVDGITLPLGSVAHIQHLNLSGNVFGDEALSEFASALMDRRFPNLKSLFLARCGIARTGADELVAALAGMELNHLDIANNNFGTHRLTTLLAVVRAENLSIRGSRMSKFMLRDILEALPSSNLKTLDISGTKLHAQDIMALQPYFKKLHLRGINFSGCRGDDIETKKLKDMLIGCGIISN